MVPFDQKSGGKGVSANRQQNYVLRVSVEEHCGAAGCMLSWCSKGTIFSKVTQMQVKWVRFILG